MPRGQHPIRQSLRLVASVYRSVNLIRVYRVLTPTPEESVGFTYLGGKHYDVFIIYLKARQRREAKGS